MLKFIFETPLELFIGAILVGHGIAVNSTFDIIAGIIFSIIGFIPEGE